MSDRFAPLRPERAASMTSQTVRRDIALCLVFFTRLPLPRPRFRATARLADAIWAAPIAGWAVALIGGAAFALASASRTGGWPGRGAGARRHDACHRLPARGRAFRHGRRFRRRARQGTDAGDHARQPHRHLRRGRACAVDADALERDFRPRDTDGGQSADWRCYLRLIAAHGASRALLPAFLRAVPPARVDGLSAGAGTVEAGVAGTALALRRPVACCPWRISAAT